MAYGELNERQFEARQSELNRRPDSWEKSASLSRLQLEQGKRRARYLQAVEAMRGQVGKMAAFQHLLLDFITRYRMQPESLVSCRSSSSW